MIIDTSIGELTLKEINEFIIILSAFGKKTQKTPLDELHKAKQRLKEYKI